MSFQGVAGAEPSMIGMKSNRRGPSQICFRRDASDEGFDSDCASAGITDWPAAGAGSAIAMAPSKPA